MTIPVSARGPFHLQPTVHVVQWRPIGPVEVRDMYCYGDAKERAAKPRPFERPRAGRSYAYGGVGGRPVACQ